MGKQYRGELACFQQTFLWSLNQSVSELSNFVGAAYSLPLITVGSGGSQTAAQFATLLHQETGGFAKSVTPYEARGISLRHANVLIFTASGGNPDILNTFRSAVTAEPVQLMALCIRKESQLETLVKKYLFTRISSFDLPCGKDGFLATNSLLATVTLLIRAYHGEKTLPTSLPNCENLLEHFEPLTQSLLPKETWVVLYGGWGLPAAVDLESKLTEAAILNVQLADYRNFAHGRHHWLAKRAASTGVVALITPDENDIAQKTLALLPDSIPVLTISTESLGASGSLDLLVQALHLVQIVGSARGIDPGNPKVPEFGRRIYHLRTSALSTVKGVKNIHREAAVSRKLQSLSTALTSPAFHQLWVRAHDRFVLRLAQATFTGVVFDFDGTLCDSSERFTGPSADIKDELVKLLEAGVIVGIATGRGKSVRVAFQRIIPEHFWKLFLIGYYNGSDIATLDEISHPDVNTSLHPTLMTIKERLEGDSLLLQLARIEVRPKQITIQPVNTSVWSATRCSVLSILACMQEQNVRCVESSHSIDIIPKDVSKLSLVTACEDLMRNLGHTGDTLCIGDKGKWPGNDFALLSNLYSLSVDEVSPELDSCWNLALPGHRGVQATLEYLRHLYLTEQGVRYRV